MPMSLSILQQTFFDANEGDGEVSEDDANDIEDDGFGMTTIGGPVNTEIADLYDDEEGGELMKMLFLSNMPNEIPRNMQENLVSPF